MYVLMYMDVCCMHSARTGYIYECVCTGYIYECIPHAHAHVCIHARIHSYLGRLGSALSSERPPVLVLLCVFRRILFSIAICVCVECNRDHHSEILRAGMHAPPASCQRDLLSGTKSRQREEDSEGLKCLFTLSLHLRLSSFRHASKPLACLAWKPNNFWLSSCK